MMKKVFAILLFLALLTSCAMSEEQTPGEATQETVVQAEMPTDAAEFYGIIGKKMTVRARGDENAYSMGTLEADTVVDVYKKGRTWTQIDYKGQKGYVLTKFIERVQRKNPFDGPMPGVSRHIAVGYVLRDTSFRPDGYKYPIQVTAGSWLSIETIKNGKAYFPYRRLTENVSMSTDMLELFDFVPWDEAQPGDLIYAFTTFYSTSAKKEGNVGRLHNIALATQRLTNIRVKTGETFSFNSICGPYTKENGYQSAPILSGESSMGYGGGVCQVCSTIYNIVLRVPMVIEDMNWHSQAGTSYLPSGFDATVGTNSDLVVRNILPYDVRIEFESQDGTMTAFLFRDYEE